MARPQVQIEGSRRLRRELRRAGADLGDLRTAHLQAAGIAAQAGRGEAPRRSGALAGSVRPGATRTAGMIRAGGRKVPYAGVQEYGWPARGIREQAYLRGGAQASEAAWLNIYWRELEQALGRIANR